MSSRSRSFVPALEHFGLVDVNHLKSKYDHLQGFEQEDEAYF